MGRTKKSNPLSDVRKWRARDKHTGIDVFDGHPYTYEHVERFRTPPERAEVYRIETYIPYVHPTPVHRNVHYVTADRLDAFFDGWGDYAETIVDIRPMTAAAALAELTAFREQAAQITEGQ
jgi:hypothetical protein